MGSGQAAGYSIESCGDQTFFQPARCFRGRTLTVQSDRSFQKDGDLDERNCLLGITAILAHLYPVPNFGSGNTSAVWLLGVLSITEAN